MQGYILNIARYKDEDLIVSILTENALQTLYRFYGARHSTINIGYKIDFIMQYSAKSTMPMLRDITHIGFKWIMDFNVMLFWQAFMKLLYKHLYGASEIDDFYFELCENAVKKLEKQSVKRTIIETYILLLEHEGRLHHASKCYLCEKELDGENVSLLRAFLPTHPECSFRKTIPKTAYEEMVAHAHTLFFSDEEVEILWQTMQEGL